MGQSIKSNPAMISLLVLVASAACAPQYGPPPPLPPTRPPPVPTPSPSPEKLIAPVTPAVACTVAYVTVWNTELQRLCKPTTRQECTTNYVEECSTIYKNVCVQKYRTEYEPYTETECTTEYKQDCQYEWQGEGNDKVWAPIDGTCQNVPYDECKDVEKTHARQVAYEACHEQPEESCISVPKESCITVADEICQSEPLTKCEDVPKQSCHKEHRRVPIRVSKAVPKKTCSTNVLPASTPAIVAPQIPAVQPSPFPLCLPPSSDLMRGSLTATTSSSEPSPPRSSM